MLIFDMGWRALIHYCKCSIDGGGGRSINCNSTHFLSYKSSFYGLKTIFFWGICSAHIDSVKKCNTGNIPIFDFNSKFYEK